MIVIVVRPIPFFIAYWCVLITNVIFPWKFSDCGEVDAANSTKCISNGESFELEGRNRRRYIVFPDLSRGLLNLHQTTRIHSCVLMYVAIPMARLF
jgi:hypothetical protein